MGYSNFIPCKLTWPNPPSPSLLSPENLFVALSIVTKSNCKDSTVVISHAVTNANNRSKILNYKLEHCFQTWGHKRILDLSDLLILYHFLLLQYCSSSFLSLLGNSNPQWIEPWRQKLEQLWWLSLLLTFCFFLHKYHHMITLL